ncbi:hypothetical protein GCM10028808_33320 [Spirosoma migulaei]
MDSPSRDLLDASELLAQPLKPTRWTNRLANLLIDTVFFYIIFGTLGTAIALISPEFLDSLSRIHPILNQVLSSLLFVIYYLAFEIWLGKTPGKIITKTKVVDQEGNKPDVKTCLGRNFARLIPFDGLTFFQAAPIGMHDRMSHTMVVDDLPALTLDQSLRNIPE